MSGYEIVRGEWARAARNRPEITRKASATQLLLYVSWSWLLNVIAVCGVHVSRWAVFAYAYAQDPAKISHFPNIIVFKFISSLTIYRTASDYAFPTVHNDYYYVRERGWKKAQPLLVHISPIRAREKKPWQKHRQIPGRAQTTQKKN